MSDTKLMLRIKSCNDGMRWYSDKVGQLVPFLGNVGYGEYKSREDAGFTNFVLHKDAEVVEVCNETGEIVSGGDEGTTKPATVQANIFVKVETTISLNEGETEQALKDSRHADIYLHTGYGDKEDLGGNVAYLPAGEEIKEHTIIDKRLFTAILDTLNSTGYEGNIYCPETGKSFTFEEIMEQAHTL